MCLKLNGVHSQDIPTLILGKAITGIQAFTHSYTITCIIQTKLLTRFSHFIDVEDVVLSVILGYWNNKLVNKDDSFLPQPHLSDPGNSRFRGMAHSGPIVMTSHLALT